jgi:hypothetical protein
VQPGTLTGAEVRRLPNPEIDTDRDLFLIAGADENDRLIHDEERLEVTDGMSFFTIPRTILAGGQPQANGIAHQPGAQS